MKRFPGYLWSLLAAYFLASLAHFAPVEAVAVN